MTGPQIFAGRALDVIARHYKLKRRWFGLEPDRMLRWRVYESMVPSIKNRHRINWYSVFVLTISGIVFTAIFAVLLVWAMNDPLM